MEKKRKKKERKSIMKGSAKILALRKKKIKKAKIKPIKSSLY